MVEQTAAATQPVKELKLTKRSSLDANPWWAQGLIYLVLIVAGLITLLPMVNVWAISFSEAHEIYKNPMMLWPKSFTLESYKYIFNTQVLLKAFGITVFVTLVGTFLNLIFTATGAYGLSKTHIPGHRFLLWIVIIPMLFGAGLIPMYILLKNIGLLNSIWVMIIPQLVAPFNLILMRNFFWSIPESLEESARIDGASDMRVLWSIILPLSKPVIATVGLFYAVGHWNDFFSGLFFISDNSKWPLQMVLRSIVIDFNMLNMGTQNTSTLNDSSKLVVQPENIKAATIIFAIVPILVVYPFLQKYFVKGIMLGSVKG
ncbi:carbohydrate ABC transporter permease [Paenibacillus lignilyticus]|uniref:Carbohydrate ABC transporter permease n=1 Tax=Paenibacillus lignilyticus TaxID=1172615 RepID=A0ABS5CAH6_9BACL|nr:carbohydrate ABC transporter permease [Paenibacillus lignilyticus]MBP3962995.1 carbohydrate ABC transporter permease [Paenibacillus lignilyticus]